MKRPLLCRLGFHSIYGNVTASNLGTDEQPVFLMSSSLRCNRCAWEEKR